MKYFYIFTAAISLIFSFVLGKITKLEREAGKNLDELKKVMVDLFDKLEGLVNAMDICHGRLNQLESIVEDQEKKIASLEMEIKMLKAAQTNDLEDLTGTKVEQKPRKKKKTKKAQTITVTETEEGSKDI